jgi:predicted ATPase/DNA-binding CsgD family transcriptional regulator
MARRIPTVRNGTLHEHIEEVPSIDGIVVGSDAWYTWLEHHHSFHFAHSSCTFSARKEQRSGGWYWYAYRRHAGRLRTAYVGRSTELSVTRLEVIAAELAGLTGTQDLQMPARDHVSVPHDSILFQPEVELIPHNNLPPQLTSLVGREQDAAAAEKLLRRPEVRLLTLTGPAGIGKTRLALQVATDLLESYPDGVYFVNLAALRDPDLVLPTVAQTLALREVEGQPLLALLKDKHLLLVLDNFEQVVTAASSLVEMLEACPDLNVLVTSREVLRLRAEHQFPVSPLSLPDLKRLPAPEALQGYAAVALFVQRVQTVRPDFQMTEANARVVAEICTRLEGVPLAIELAAARVKVLSLPALLTGLERRLHLLTGGARDLPERQQTLRNTIQWSYDLLSEEEQQFFRRLAVFDGGCSLKAIEEVSTAVSDGASNMLDRVTSLVDKSLMQENEQASGEVRLMMLEMLRGYGLEYLEMNGETEVSRQAHALYYLAWVEEVESKLIGEEHVSWLERLEQEHDNLRAALRWFLEQNAMELLLRLGGALRIFWEVRGHISEGRRWLESGLEGRSSVSTPVLAKALYSAGTLAAIQVDGEGARVLFAESLRLFRALGDKRGTSATLCALGYITCYINDDVGRAMLEESLALSRELGDRYKIAEALDYLGNVAEWREEYSKARDAYEESLAICRDLIDHEGMQYVLAHLANIYFVQGDYATAQALYKESLTINEKIGHRRGIASVQHLLAGVFLYQGDFVQAYSLAEQSLLLSREIAEKGNIPASLTILGQLACYRHDYAAAQALLEESLTLSKEVGHQQRIVHSLSSLARAVFIQGDDARARSLYEESFTSQMKSTARTWYLAECLEGLGQVIAAQEEYKWAARVWGAAERLREALGVPIPPVYRPMHEHAVALALATFGEKAFTAAWEEGRAMTPEQAFAALQQASMSEPVPAAKQPSSSTYPNDVTAREMDVLRLLAQGLTSAQIAEQLFIGVVTVNFHVRSIYSKLGVSSRSAATRYALEHQLV